MTNLEKIESLFIGDSIIDLNGKQIEKMKENVYYIHCTSSGWKTATVTKTELIEVFVTGKKDLLSLIWE